VIKLVGLWVLVYVFGRLPVRVLYLAADVVGTGLWYVSPRIRGVTREHMAHVLGVASVSGTGASRRARDRAARGCARSAMRYYADLARSAHLGQEAAFAETESFEGLDGLFAAYDCGQGVVMASAHVGTPEFLARASGYLGFEIVVLTEPLQPRRVNDLMHRLRNRPGVRFVPADLQGVRVALEALRRGALVAVMCDRDIQGNGRPVPLFGERARLPSGAVELALRTGAPIVPGFVYRLGPGRCRMRFLPPLEFPRTGEREAAVEAGMLALARALEEGISAAPEQWFALQPVWSGLPGTPREARAVPRRNQGPKGLSGSTG
jgi:KDO2-lipid IV(A) lauroyltransferase